MSKIVGTLLLLGLLFAVILSIGLILVQWVRSNDTSNTKKAAVVYTISAPASGLVENSAALKDAVAVRQTWSAADAVASILNVQANSVQAVVATPQSITGS